MEEKYDLKWKTYSDHLVGVFKELGEEGHFADVTLVSDDHVQTKAHKVVLSACSPVLKTLLVNNPHSHPLLYLRGIKQTELQAILKFMYFGETQIFEDRINDFVSVAKDLEVKEISEEQYDDESENVPEVESNLQDELKRDNINDEVHDGEQVMKREQTLNTERTLSRPRQKSDKSIVNSEGRFNCDECEATFRFRSDVGKHKRSKHEGKTYYCNECESSVTDPSKN